MENVKSIGLLFGAGKPEGAKEAKRVAAQDLWLSDFKGAPEWFVKKYFTDGQGKPCGRMHIKAFAKVGDIVTDGGKVRLNRWGRPVRLTTGMLAKKVESDCEAAGFPGVRIHFKGYGLDPERFVLSNAFLQEEYEENEARHVPGLDEDAKASSGNPQAPLEKALWESCASFAMNALRTKTLIYWGLDEDFPKVLSATDFVHEAYNAYLAGLWARISSLVTPETLMFASKSNDFALFGANDVVRAYAKAMRALTGKEVGEPMLSDLALLDPDMDAGLVKRRLENAMVGALTPETASSPEDVVALILANQDPTDAVADWEYEAKDDESLFDDDTGELATGLLLRY